MHNPDWSQFTLLDHLVACAMLFGYVLLIVAIAAILLAPLLVPMLRKVGR